MGSTLFGSQRVTRDEISAIITPPRTETHYPIPHEDALDLVDKTLARAGVEVVKRQYQLSHEGNRMFSTYDFATTNKDFTQSLGIRNAHDKKFPYGLASGATIFVCANLMFNGEEVVSRKHTKNIWRDLPSKIDEVVHKFISNFGETAKWFDFWQNRKINDSEAKAFLWDIAQSGALPYKFTKDVIFPEWEKPSHGEHGRGTIWTLHNAFTEGMKERHERNPHRACTESQVVDGMFRNRWEMAVA